MAVINHNIALSEKVLCFRDVAGDNHRINYDGALKGLHLQGWRGIEFAYCNGTMLTAENGNVGICTVSSEMVSD